MEGNEPEDINLINQYKNANENIGGSVPTILAMGVGGGGCNAVDYMAKQGVKGVDFVVLNTDRQALLPIEVPTKILLGPKLCKGQGAGSQPEKGRQAAEESAEEIEKLYTEDVQMVFITAGMGGGTGTGAAPVVAEIAKKRGILTVGIVTIPFFFEGMERIKAAIRGASRLQKNVDAMLIINNDRLSTIYPTLKFEEGFHKADEILTTAARTISDMVTILANINIDMKDVDTCLRDGRTALISVGYGEGENRLATAINNALHSPLLCNTNIMSAKKLLFAFYYSHDIDPPLLMSESQQANNLVASIQQHVHIKFGWGFDDTLGNKIKFSILASGFDVSVDTNGMHIEVIEGKKDEVQKTTAEDLDTISIVYGEEKVGDLIRKQETQNYYIFETADLDNDDMIALVEATPAYNRDKRNTTHQAPSLNVDLNPVKPAEAPKPGSISFSLDDR